MKRVKISILFVLITLVIFAAFAACSQKPQPGYEPTNQLEEILQRGKLIIATSPDFAPAEFIDSRKEGQSQYIGAEISMAKYIANQLGVQLEIQAMDFSAVLSSVSLGTTDMAISSFGWTEDREGSFELSEGYNLGEGVNRFSFLVPRDKLDQYQSLEDFSGKTIAVQAGSLQETYTKEQVPGANLEIITSVDVGIMMLKTNKVDALTIHFEQAGGFMSTNPELAKAAPEMVENTGLKTNGNVLAVKKGETALISRLNGIIAEINQQNLYPGWVDQAKIQAKELGIEFEGSDEFVVPEVEKGVWAVFKENYGLFLDGLLGTLQLAAITLLFGMLLGAAVAFLRISKIKILSFLAVCYIELIRGTPILVQLYIFYFVVPEAFPALNLSKYVCVVISLVINSGAYLAETMRSGIQAVDVGQSEAAKSLGMRPWNMMTRIILPQAVKNILPALCNEFITIIKETSLASVLFINELMYARTLLQSTKFYTWQPLFIIAIIYFVVTFTLSKLVRLFERRMKKSD